VFVPGRPFHPNIIFVGKARSASPTQIGSSLARKYQAMAKRPERDKHSSLFSTFIGYEEKNIVKLTIGGGYSQKFLQKA
jgi:hypothetical protein